MDTISFMLLKSMALNSMFSKNFKCSKALCADLYQMPSKSVKKTARTQKFLDASN
jgi:hypothetical protein